MKSLHNQKGFSAVEGIIILVILAAIAFAGYTVWQAQNEDAPANTTPTTQQEETIENEEDLQEAENELNELNVDELDSTELDEAEAELL